MAATDDPAPLDARHPALRLGLLFGALYFIQGIAEPTAGLIAQPVRYLLKSWDQSAGQITTFEFFLALPWSIKPLYGLITDFVPLFGLRRKSYLIITNGVAAMGLLSLYFFPPATGAVGQLWLLLFLPTVGVAFADVVIDALMVEKGQPLGLTGKLQSVQWAAIYIATVLVGFLGGFLSENKQADVGFLICGVMSAVAVVLCLTSIRETPHAATELGLGAIGPALWQAARNPTLRGVVVFLFLWNFNPFSTTVLNVHMTREMQLSEQFVGNLTSLDALAAITACLAYGFYCRRVPFRWLLHLSIVTGIIATLAYWGLRGERSAMVISMVVGFTYMTATLIQLDLAARHCPPACAGTLFALLMSTSNLSQSLSTLIGGSLYDDWLARWNSGIAFQLLVGVGALCTAGCWLITPWLRENNDTTHHRG